MVLVPAGEFTMGDDSGRMNERPAHKVIVDAFVIDRYEVSAREFSDFLNKKGNPDDRYFSSDRYSTIEALPKEILAGPNAGADMPYYLPKSGFESFPANNVSWEGAYAYCREKGMRLPTEAEWEKAARGPDRRLYPWGNDPDSDRARFNQKWQDKGLEVMSPVDSLPEGASVYGAFNMAGNVWEWTSDWYRYNMIDYCNPFYEGDMDTVFELAPPTGLFEVSMGVKSQQVPPRSDPTGISLGNFKSLRGGSWYDRHGDLVTRSTFRYQLKPEDRYPSVGFRCASSIE
jgi:formylglycine-generating enzyme required for sulfatase activity